jgi:AraC-like DNA-binding protein
MPASPPHQCRVLATPWEGVYGTQIESARHYRRHSHAVFGIGLMERGAQKSASGRGQVEAYAGDIIMCNPGEVHDGQPLGSPSRRWRMLYLEPAAMADAMGVPGAAAGLELIQPVAQDPRLRLALHEVLDRLQRGGGGRGPLAAVQALACEEALAQVFALLPGRHALARASAPSTKAFSAATARIQQVRDRLAADLLAPPTLGEMALAAGLSKFQLLRHFEKAFGLTPHAWLLQQRAERARGLIRAGAGLAQTAASCGFADQSHMTRLFTRQFGFTPGAWQQAAARHTAGALQ